MDQQDHNEHIENTAAEHGSDDRHSDIHSNMSPSSPNGHPFRVPGRRARTTSEYVQCVYFVTFHNGLPGPLKLKFGYVAIRAALWSTSLFMERSTT